MIYLDYNASVPLRPCAQNSLLAALEMKGNSSSPHHAGRKLRAIIDTARQTILDEIEAKRLIFTSGGTESNILALLGLNSLPVLVSSIEHESILKAASNPILVPVTQEGLIDLKELKQFLSSFETPGLISVMLVNNETGVIQPIREVVDLAHEYGWKVHTDASQALGYIPLSFKSLGVDMMTLSSHKCGGPVGIGALVIKEGIQLQPVIRGGGQEYGMRSGTLSAPLVLGFAAALTEAVHDLPNVSRHLHQFQQKIETSLSEGIVYGKKSPRVSHVVSIGMPGVSGELQLMAFDLKGIAVSVGSACSSGKTKESHVLKAMGVSPEAAKSAIRVSFGWQTQELEIDRFIQAWKDIYAFQNMKEAI